MIEDRNVADERSLEALYQRSGRRSNAAPNSAWETSAAQDAGSRGRRELTAQPATAALRVPDSDKL